MKKIYIIAQKLMFDTKSFFKNSKKENKKESEKAYVIGYPFAIYANNYLEAIDKYKEVIGSYEWINYSNTLECNLDPYKTKEDYILKEVSFFNYDLNPSFFTIDWLMHHMLASDFKEWWNNR